MLFIQETHKTINLSSNLLNMLESASVRYIQI